MAFNFIKQKFNSLLNYVKGSRQQFEVYINEGEYRQIEDWVLQKPNIETGGDLFGLWIDQHRAVVQFVLGPGKKCRRSPSSFFQDISHLDRVGGYLVENQGLCNIGQWHSHHHLDLKGPSYGDTQTVWGNLKTLNLETYIVFIATIDDDLDREMSVDVNCFLFKLDATTGDRLPVMKGKFNFIENNSPMRLNYEIYQRTVKGDESTNKIFIIPDEEITLAKQNVIVSVSNDQQGSESESYIVRSAREERIRTTEREDHGIELKKTNNCNGITNETLTKSKSSENEEKKNCETRSENKKETDNLDIIEGTADNVGSVSGNVMETLMDSTGTAGQDKSENRTCEAEDGHEVEIGVNEMETMNLVGNFDGNLKERSHENESDTNQDKVEDCETGNQHKEEIRADNKLSMTDVMLKADSTGNLEGKDHKTKIVLSEISSTRFKDEQGESKAGNESTKEAYRGTPDNVYLERSILGKSERNVETEIALDQGARKVNGEEKNECNKLAQDTNETNTEDAESKANGVIKLNENQGWADITLGEIRDTESESKGSPVYEFSSKETNVEKMLKMDSQVTETERIAESEDSSQRSLAKDENRMLENDGRKNSDENASVNGDNYEKDIGKICIDESTGDVQKVIRSSGKATEVLDVVDESSRSINDKKIMTDPREVRLENSGSTGTDTKNDENVDRNKDMNVDREIGHKVCTREATDENPK